MARGEPVSAPPLAARVARWLRSERDDFLKAGVVSIYVRSGDDAKASDGPPLAEVEVTDDRTSDEIAFALAEKMIALAQGDPSPNGVGFRLYPMSSTNKAQRQGWPVRAHRSDIDRAAALAEVSQTSALSPEERVRWQTDSATAALLVSQQSHANALHVQLQRANDDVRQQSEIGLKALDAVVKAMGQLSTMAQAAVSEANQRTRDAEARERAMHDAVKEALAEAKRSRELAEKFAGIAEDKTAERIERKRIFDVLEPIAKKALNGAADKATATANGKEDAGGAKQ